MYTNARTKRDRQGLGNAPASATYALPSPAIVLPRSARVPRAKRAMSLDTSPKIEPQGPLSRSGSSNPVQKSSPESAQRDDSPSVALESMGGPMPEASLAPVSLPVDPSLPFAN